MMNLYSRINEIKHLLHVAAAPSIYSEETYTTREMSIAMANKMNEIIDAVNLLADTLETLIQEAEQNKGV